MTEAKSSSAAGDPRIAARLSDEIEGDVWFDAFSRGRYATDASAYQIEPVGVVVPRTWQDVISAIQIAADEEIAVLPRGAGTSQCGQTVGQALVIDTSAYLNSVIKLDPARQRVCVEPGMVLDHLNLHLYQILDLLYIQQATHYQLFQVFLVLFQFVQSCGE